MCIRDRVTNPPIDPLREAVVMSLETCLGAECSLFEESSDYAPRPVSYTHLDVYKRQL